MPNLDRESFIALLEKLGSDNDQDVLAAARELDARVRAAGVGWTDLLAPADGAEAQDDDDEDDQDHDHEDVYDDDDDEDYDDDREDHDDRDDREGDDEDADRAGADAGDDTEERRARPSNAADDESAALIDRLLNDFDLSEETRQDLLDLRQDIEAGDFTEMDRRYIDALRARLARD